jgi:hypothetical protein
MSQTESFLKLIAVLNLTDALFTVVFIYFFNATEANPFMGWLLSLGIGYFFITKVVIVNILIGFLYKTSSSCITEKGAALIASLYLIVNILHIYVFLRLKILALLQLL